MREYSTRELYADFLKSRKGSREAVPKNPRRLSFTGTSGLDIYNLTAPFLLEDKPVLAARGEPRENHDSRVFLFQRAGENWSPRPQWKPLPMEDPFFFRLGKTPYLGGVETFPADNGYMGWSTAVYDITSLSAPRLIFRGPRGMKDLRFIQYSDDAIGVFTRPRGGQAGRGTCGYLETESLSGLTPEEVAAAPLISAPDENSWEGINQPILLEDNRIGLLGHVAWMEEGEIRHYYAAVSEFSREERIKTPWRIIAQRDDLPPGPAKREDLTDVLFPGGIIPGEPGAARLYLGVSDTEAWTVEIPDPFSPQRRSL